ncbi:NAD(P)-dependent oxidoreductase [Cerasicoccus maritimus]|uniref:NAD(P)-dependent oxidoreductase n=1 Tax=Cerasicoccus maritimus TaxID=490089 RepID=UPI002852A127|nr:NAD(P)-dependent oxidoreductase [Cerasicoccus maritimus]
MSRIFPDPRLYTWVKGSTERELEAIIQDVQPEIILGAWSTPRLPIINGKPPASIYCHICGSVRHQVDKRHLELGMKVTNWGNTVAKTVAESAIMLALAALRNVGYHTNSLHYEKGWRDPKSPPQKSFIGAKIGIHGMGQVGASLAKFLQPYEAEISAYDPYAEPSAFLENNVRRVADIDELFHTSEVFFECCALTPETVGVVDRRRIQMLPVDAVFINVGRGELVDEFALANAISERRLRAGLDVYQTEPLPEDSPLRGLRGMIGTPHLGGNNVKSHRNAGVLALKNIDAYLSQAPLTNEITIEQYERMT